MEPNEDFLACTNFSFQVDFSGRSHKDPVQPGEFVRATISMTAISPKDLPEDGHLLSINY